ncbi:hypothetical protein E4T66_18535 [Sinimarinibacterium sp. CAU 1509]|uniref:hypothetical protein n=1 Tax=Sinimarinibacterium sp. CAU 1509 TaxID=2562283 RepID=UPI0010ACDC1E|nr:hypothetical protein [Sinimarinibacterium sp. CAU 1509]TJY57405.1 hypothetical protein E4T66_18535 [Sinimarinibacterium sp. CAU 1509]
MPTRWVSAAISPSFLILALRALEEFGRNQPADMSKTEWDLLRSPFSGHDLEIRRKIVYLIAADFDRRNNLTPTDEVLYENAFSRFELTHIDSALSVYGKTAPPEIVNHPRQGKLDEWKENIALFREDVVALRQWLTGRLNSNAMRCLE